MSNPVDGPVRRPPKPAYPLTVVWQLSERFACKVIGLSRSAYRRLPLAQTPDDPDADLRSELRS